MRAIEMSRIVMHNQQYQNNKINPLSNGSSPSGGHIHSLEDPYMNITGKSPSEWQKIVPVDDEVADKIRNLVKEDFVKRNGMCGYGQQADAQANIIKKYVATLPGEQRLSATYSCEQIAFEETDRLSAKIREHNPGWQYGQPFDTSILDETPKGGFHAQA